MADPFRDFFRICVLALLVWILVEARAAHGDAADAKKQASLAFEAGDLASQRAFEAISHAQSAESSADTAAEAAQQCAQ